jgi:hypothetical protein
MAVRPHPDERLLTEKPETAEASLEPEPLSPTLSPLRGARGDELENPQNT